ncbi:MAG TPA: MogA/MoaB family molybdenum cofactor biosynthesis protein [Desulfatirhabdiaceae bacterium]|nr:MogA/MoaB family molybdenum cofactor biosynthesis protein [Desulfatirhabdiaceae bacterium]
MGLKDHKADAPNTLKTAVISVSSTRTLAEDKSGIWISRHLSKEGHAVVSHRVVPDDATAIADHLKQIITDQQADAVLITGGTGISHLDVTIEAVKPLFVKELTAFGVLFAILSHEEIDSAAILSRATAGTIDNTVVFCIPGSLAACKLACTQLIFPELGHLLRHIQKG